MSVIDEIAAERSRQIDEEGWSAEHDDQKGDHNLLMAGICYATSAMLHDITPRLDKLEVDPFWLQAFDLCCKWWPFEYRWWKPKDRRRDMIRALALMVAEIEKWDRAQP